MASFGEWVELSSFRRLRLVFQSESWELSGRWCHLLAARRVHREEPSPRVSPATLLGSGGTMWTKSLSATSSHIFVLLTCLQEKTINFHSITIDYCFCTNAISRTSAERNVAVRVSALDVIRMKAVGIVAFRIGKVSWVAVQRVGNQSHRWTSRDLIAV